MMKKFEYTFIKKSSNIGFDYEKKIDEAEKMWNELGQEGWQFCRETRSVIIFIREIIES